MEKSPGQFTQQVEGYGNAIVDALDGAEMQVALTALNYVIAYLFSDWPDDKRRAAAVLFSITLAETVERDINAGDGTAH